jgi:hypothetical protein
MFFDLVIGSIRWLRVLEGCEEAPSEGVEASLGNALPCFNQKINNLQSCIGNNLLFLL